MQTIATITERLFRDGTLRRVVVTALQTDDVDVINDYVSELMMLMLTHAEPTRFVEVYEKGNIFSYLRRAVYNMAYGHDKNNKEYREYEKRKVRISQAHDDREGREGVSEQSLEALAYAYEVGEAQSVGETIDDYLCRDWLLSQDGRRIRKVENID